MHKRHGWIFTLALMIAAGPGLSREQGLKAQSSTLESPAFIASVGQSAGAQQAHFRVYVNDVRDCLREIEQNGAEPATDPTAMLRARRLRHSIAWSIVLVVGVLLLGWLILR